MKSIVKTIAATALAATLLTPAGAQAGGSGQLSINIAPQNAQEAQAMRLGLALFALHQDIETNGHVTQRGVNNAAGIYQGGPNNRAILHQEGCNHTGTIHQQNANNAAGLFQFGCNTNGHIAQNGNETGVTIQVGW
jgi:minor curlin subunit